MNSNILFILGWGSFALFAFMQVPQIIKTIQTKSVAGLSQWTSLIYTIALLMSCIYLYYFNQEKPWPAILNQAFSSVLSLFQFLLYHKYKKQ